MHSLIRLIFLSLMLVLGATHSVQAAGKWVSKDAKSSTGVYLSESGARYEGGYKGDMRHGQGTSTSPSGVSFTGEWSEDEPVNGTHKSPVGIYVGGLKGGSQSGQGKQTLSSGTVFEGDWIDGKLSRGRRISPDGTVSEGDWIDGKLNRGQMTEPNGSVYNGELRGLQRWGQGRQVYANGSTQEGMFVNDVFVEGVFSSKDYMLKGTFEKGKLNGFGVERFTNGQIYEGGFVSGLRNGVGKITFRNGDRYQGQFKDGQAHGRGIYTSKEGVYDGQHVNGKQSGYGVMTYVGPGYQKYEGEWKDGNYHGQGAVTTWSGTVVAGRYENGDLVAQSDAQRSASGGPSFGQLFVAAAGVAAIAGTGGVAVSDKTRLATSFASDVLGDGSGTATAATTAELKRREEALRQTSGKSALTGGASQASSARPSSACVSLGQIGSRDGMSPECYKNKQNTFGWGKSESAACEGAHRSVKDEFDAQNKNPSGCYCKANASVNSVTQPFVCWVMFDG